ncbi:MAG: response regulator [Desulfoferrobacter sp.]
MRKRKLLFIKNDADNGYALSYVMSIFKRKGWKIKCVNSGEQVFDVLSKNFFAAIFIDVSLCVMDSLWLCQWIKRFNKDSSMIAICTPHQKPSRYRAGGFDEVLQKPFDMGEVIEIVDRSFEKHLDPDDSFFVAKY